MELKALTGVVFFLIAACIATIAQEDEPVFDTYPGDDNDDGSSGEDSKCSARNSICRSLLKTEEVDEVINEGELCKCAGCVETWGDEKDKRAITWYHQERRDFIIQYRTCSKVLPDEICDDDIDFAVKITTGVNNWKPKVAKAQCRCKGGIFYLKEWWRKKERWEYTYTCNLPTCEKGDQSICFQQYRSEKGVNGVRFPCSCEEGYKCPLDDEKSRKAGNDENGDIMVGYCVPLYDHASVGGDSKHEKKDDSQGGVTQ